jgi:capsular exopolysaccharide synthesis family protein
MKSTEGLERVDDIEQAPPELATYLEVLRSRWKLVAVILVAVIGSSVWRTSRSVEFYRAHSDVLLRSRLSEQLFGPGAGNLSSNVDVVQTEIEVIESELVQNLVEKRLGRAADVSAVAKQSTAVVVISAVDRVPKRAAETVNAYVESYIEFRRGQLVEDLAAVSAKLQEQVVDLRTTVLQIRAPLSEIDRRIVGTTDLVVRAQIESEREQLARTLAPTLSPLEVQLSSYEQQLSDLKISRNLVQTGGAQVIRKARVPRRPFSPNPRTDLMGAVATGLLLAIAAAFLANHLDRRVRSVEAVRSVARWPLLASVPQNTRLFSEGSVLAWTHPTSAPAEAFRSLRTSLLLSAVDRPFHTLQVTSASPGDGKSTTAANLAVNLARSGRRVLLVDLDLRRPTLHTLFGIEGGPGVAEVLVGDATLSDAIRVMPEEEKLSVLIAGTLPADSTDLVGLSAVVRLIEEAAATCDVLVIDTSPIQPVADPLVVSSHVDGVVFVVAEGRTRRDDLVGAVERLRQVKAPVLGIVVNRVGDAARPYGYKAGSAYGRPYGSRGSSRISSLLPHRRKEPTVVTPLSGPVTAGSDAATG